MELISWDALYQRIEACAACPLHAGCTRKVPGQGDRKAQLMVIGEGPGAEEDRQGLPFVGAAGELLTRMLAAIALKREDVYICNVVKCRPPENRTPTPEEVAACLPYLRMQTALIRPRVILLLGATAAKAVLHDPSFQVTRDRGKWVSRAGVWMLVTYHPAALLRDPAKKHLVWEDMKSLRAKLDELAQPLP